jgi:uncharacterized caspase-like protein
MANHACVAIGINRYQFLQPLSYGQADAQALRQFLVRQASLPSNQCLLLTDTSPLVDDQSTYPSRENILSWLRANPQNSRQSETWRWFFFSGYGVNWQNADYLMPIDGNPDDIPGTGISMRSLFESLKAQGSENILVLLDINRASGLQSGIPVGAQAVELARQMGIVLVLSSQLDQFSHEASALGHGLFTEALLEALGYYHTDTTLEHLEQYLHARLPELSQHHWRPVQTPLTVVPSEAQRQQLILPSVKNQPIKERTPVGVSSTFIPKAKLETENGYIEDSRNGATPGQKTPLSATQTRPNTSLISPPTVTSTPATYKPGAMVASPERQPKRHVNTPWWQQLLLWGGGAILILALMIAAVVFRNRDAFTTKSINETPATRELPTSPTAQEPLTTSPPSPTAKASPTVSSNPSDKLLVAAPQKPTPTRLQANQAALDQAKRLIRPNQASLFSKAIVQARTVKPGEPLYQQAKQDITRWSEVILDLAEGRANQGNFGGAIAAAQLVPKDNPSVYAKAQKTINQWKVLTNQQRQNQAIIQAAKKQIQPNQASSYNRSLTTLRKIPVGQPGYAEAQQLIAQGSQKIYLIAQSRASQGKFKEAVQAAALVPANTPSYEAAQKAIAKWKQGKR